MINPFVISNTAEQARFRALTDDAIWYARCEALGVDRATAQAYSERAYQIAMTTVYPNSDVVAFARQLALDALTRGAPMPATPEAAFEHEQGRALRRWFGE
jgi:hypothetical protein